MHGVRIEGREGSGVTTGRDGPAPALSIEVRNPPVLSLVAVAFGLGCVALVGFALAESARVDPVVSRLRRLAPFVAGLAVTTAALATLRAHTRIVVEADRIVVERARKAPPARHALGAGWRVEADPVTGDVRLVGGDEIVVLAPALLPEQAALVAAALSGALPRS